MVSLAMVALLISLGKEPDEGAREERACGASATMLKLKASKAFFPLLSQKDFFLLCGLSA